MKKSQISFLRPFIVRFIEWVKDWQRNIIPFKIRVAIIKYLIRKWMPFGHFHLNPVHKKSDFIAPMPDFTVEGEKNEIE